MKDLVFLHGGGHGSWCWAPLLAELEKDLTLSNRVILLDLPGAGTKRGRDPAQETIATIAKELNDELRALDVSGAVLIGHSLAGVILPLMAAQDASLFSELIYLQASAPPEGQSQHDQMGSGLWNEDADRVGYPFDTTGMSPAELYTALFGIDFSEEQVLWLLSEMAQDAIPTALLAEPVSRKGYDPGLFSTTYVLAKRDPVLPPEWQHRFAERLGCTKIVEIDTPHEAFISHPDILAGVLKNLIS